MSGLSAVEKITFKIYPQNNTSKLLNSLKLFANVILLIGNKAF